jgi:hypothetical protein
VEREACDGQTKCGYFRKLNTWHPTKVSIISDTWNLCTNRSGIDLDIFVYLWTRMDSFDLRQEIRNTWANRTLFPSLNVGFILGSSSDGELNSMIVHENEKHGDIIQGDFMDTYRNLTFKSFVAWRWIRHNCKRAKYYLKMDGLCFLG